MAYNRIVLILIFSLGLNLIHAQSTTQAEPQLSFAKEVRPNSYYVAQAELWWDEVQKDKSSETAWFNYWRACRNAHGSANWKNDFLKKSPDLKLGKDIIALIEEHIPNTFTHYYLKGADAGISPEGSEYLIKAYAMNPDYQGISGNMISYATAVHNDKLRKEVNQHWFKKNDWSHGIMSYSYNVLASTAPNAIIFTQGDNDTYPLWMLQDAKEIRTDIWVINIDFLLMESYREPIFEELGIPPFTLENINLDEYEQNWGNVMKHILAHYEDTRPLYLAMTIDPRWYEGFEDKFSPVGLTLKFGESQTDLTKKNITLLEQEFLLDYLKVGLTYDITQERVAEMNMNYLKTFTSVHDFYLEKGKIKEAEAIRELALGIIDSRKEKDEKEKMKSWFGE